MESQDDLDHVVLLFRRGSKYGTVARSRDPGLHGRKPVFRSVRDLVFSYVDPFVDLTGRVEGYGVLDLRTLRVDWRLSTRDVWSIQEAFIRRPPPPLRTSGPRYRRGRQR